MIWDHITMCCQIIALGVIEALSRSDLLSHRLARGSDGADVMSDEMPISFTRDAAEVALKALKDVRQSWMAAAEHEGLPMRPTPYDAAIKTLATAIVRQDLEDELGKE